MRGPTAGARRTRSVAAATCLLTIVTPGASMEDPFVFQRPDGSVHCIYHDGPNSFHAFSSDGKAWTAPSTVAFNTTFGVAPQNSVPQPAPATNPSKTAEGFRCSTNADCSLLGTCTPAGVCNCSGGFTGPTCGQLDLTPAPALGAAIVWPMAGVPNSSAWGFAVAYDPSDQLYHAVVDVSCGCGPHTSVHACTEFTGVLASGGYASSLVHLSSNRPDSGFTFVGVIAPATSFNPHLVRSPEGQFALYFRVNAADPMPLCTGDPNGPSSAESSLIKVCVGSNRDNCIHAGDSERGTNMYVATAGSMAGPWTVSPVTVAGEGSLHISNPSVAYIHRDTPAAALGSLVMAFRYNSPHGENNGIAYADHPAGPFTAVANLTVTPAPPAEGFNGDPLKLNRRERPGILFDPETGAPVMLYGGASFTDTDGVYRAFSLAQRFAH